jgi:hypothetical protein
VDLYIHSPIRLHGVVLNNFTFAYMESGSLGMASPAASEGLDVCCEPRGRQNALLSRAQAKVSNGPLPVYCEGKLLFVVSRKPISYVLVSAAKGFAHSTCCSAGSLKFQRDRCWFRCDCSPWGQFLCIHTHTHTL